MLHFRGAEFVFDARRELALAVETGLQAMADEAESPCSCGLAQSR